MSTLTLSSVPSISTTLAHFLALGFSVAYVGSLYVSKNARLSFSSKAGWSRNGEARRKEREERWRDDPDVIKARLAAVTLASAVCCIIVVVIVWLVGGSKVSKHLSDPSYQEPQLMPSAALARLSPRHCWRPSNASAWFFDQAHRPG
jgi:hypothetical protein